MFPVHKILRILVVQSDPSFAGRITHAIKAAAAVRPQLIVQWTHRQEQSPKEFRQAISEADAVFLCASLLDIPGFIPAGGFTGSSLMVLCVREEQLEQHRVYSTMLRNSGLNAGRNPVLVNYPDSLLYLIVSQTLDHLV